jgi:transcriptional regulator
MMTDEQINAVAIMRRAGNSNGEIAQTLGMTYDQVGTAVLGAAAQHPTAKTSGRAKAGDN